uniref:Somatostatin/Cortistatin C-terminal domain-containing protein n=1 Tax=Graphocephala atropunctata TaxID=36148 RepID=A0A1B6MI73_9HEMI
MCSYGVIRFVASVVICALVLQVASGQPMQQSADQYFKNLQETRILENSVDSVTSDKSKHALDSVVQETSRSSLLEEVLSRISRFRRSPNTSHQLVRPKSPCKQWGQPQILPTRC